ncbi:MAG: DNA-processing protein DprA [Patescibacteria group bacterium]
MEKTPEQEKKFIVEDLASLFGILADLKKEKGTLWFGISGSWRDTSKEVEESVRSAVKQIMERGDGIVSGGALNVDYFATDEAIKLNPNGDKIKIFIPVVLDLYSSHYRKRAGEGVITPEQAEVLISQLVNLKNINPEALTENPHNAAVDPKTYYERNTEVVNVSDAIVGFQVNDSGGVQDTIDKALAQGKPVCLKKYFI